MKVNLQKLELLASKLAAVLTGEQLVILSGELGAGKTQLLRYVASHFGIQNVTSPSFTIQNIYVSGEFTIEHWDLYRINKLPMEIDYFETVKTVKFVEWGERFPRLVEQSDLVVDINIIDHEYRDIHLKGALASQIEI